MTEETYWEKAVDDLKQFNVLYAQVQKKPQDEAVLRKCVKGTDKLLNLAVWRKKCLTGQPAENLLKAERGIVRLSKDKAAPVEELQQGIEAFKAATQMALDSAAPGSFTYQGFKVSNKQHFAEELAMKALEGLDFLKALFKKRGVSKLLDQSISRVVLVYDAEAVAYFHSGTKEMVISVPEMNKGAPARILSGSLGNETLLHEFGHYVHRNYITGEAREAWNAPWGDLPSRAAPNYPSSEESESRRKKILDPLEIVTEYGKTDKFEDFAETFVAFMAAPEKLSLMAKFRMQRALSLSGLYGKPVMNLATTLRVATRYLTLASKRLSSS